MDTVEPTFRNGDMLQMNIPATNIGYVELQTMEHLLVFSSHEDSGTLNDLETITLQVRLYRKHWMGVV